MSRRTIGKLGSISGKGEAPRDAKELGAKLRAAEEELAEQKRINEFDRTIPIQELQEALERVEGERDRAWENVKRYRHAITAIDRALDAAVTVDAENGMKAETALLTRYRKALERTREALLEDDRANAFIFIDAALSDHLDQRGAE